MIVCQHEPDDDYPNKFTVIIEPDNVIDGEDRMFLELADNTDAEDTLFQWIKLGFERWETGERPKL